MLKSLLGYELGLSYYKFCLRWFNIHVHVDIDSDLFLLLRSFF